MAHDAEIVDLHLDTFIPVRLVGYELSTRHEGSILGGRLFGHLDLPRMADGGLSGGGWSITTNPFRRASMRWRIFKKNLERLRGLLEARADQVAVVRNIREYERARAAGQHACMLAVQGGNCFEAAPDGARSAPGELITRVTVVHLTNSCYGATSAPVSRFRKHKGLTEAGRSFVKQLNEARIFVDLAHIHRDGFWDAVEVHDPSQPLLSTHTGVCGVTPHWRNLDDRQLEAIAQTGGCAAIIFQRTFLARPGGPKDVRMVIEHMAHIIDVVGEDFVAVGSDYDGAVIPPIGLEGADGYPRLVQSMMDEGWDEGRIRKILGGNYLRAFVALRPC